MVDSLASGRFEKPGAWLLGYAFAGPVLPGGDDGVLQGVFRELEVSYPVDQYGERLTPLLSDGPLDGGANRFGWFGLQSGSLCFIFICFYFFIFIPFLKKKKMKK